MLSRAKAAAKGPHANSIVQRAAHRDLALASRAHLPITFLEQCDELAHLALGLYRQRVKLIKEIL